MILQQILLKMLALETKDLSESIIKGHLLKHQKMIVANIHKNQIEIKEGVFVKNGVAFLCNIIDSTEDKIVMTVVEAFDFNNTTLGFITSIIKSNTALFIDEGDYLKDVEIFIPNRIEKPHCYKNLDDIINDVRCKKKILFFNNTALPLIL